MKTFARHKRKYHFLTFLLLSSCALGPHYHTPKIDLPNAWKNAPTATSQKESIPEKSTTKIIAPEKTQEAKDIAWWKTFKDPLLADLMEKAMLSNLDVEKALASLCAARATFQGEESALLPNMTGNLSFSKTHTSQTVPKPATTPNNQRLFTPNFDASWEVNLFGWKRVLESADATLSAVLEDYRAVLVSVMGDVAKNYITLRFYQHQQGLLKEIIDLFEKTLLLQRDLFQSGLSSDIDVQTVETSLLQARGEMGAVDTNLKACIHQLGILLGLEPWALYSTLEAIAPIPTTDTVMLSALPSTLLNNRPDIRQAERDLAAATANIGVSFASFFPSFLLTGSVGWQSPNTNQLFKPKSYTLNLNPSMSLPIFDFGRIRAQINVSEALRDEAFATFKQKVLEALQDVENSLVSFTNEDARLSTLNAAASSDARALDLTQKRFKAGLTNQATVITAQIKALQSRIDALNSLMTRSLNIVSLYKALGGGWNTVPMNKSSTDVNANG